MDVDIKVFAYSFPAISLVLGFLLILTGSTGNNPELTRWGTIFVIIGVVAYAIPIIISAIME